MNRTIQIILFFLFYFLSFTGQGQSTDENLSISFNDQGVASIEGENQWKAVQSFERAIRAGGKQGRVAKRNIAKFRKHEDLPAHNLLQFGWTHGLGQIAHYMVRNGWLILSLLLLVGAILLNFKPKIWTWGRVSILIGLSITSLLLSYCRAHYVESVDIVIFTKDTDLKEKPYDVSDEKQIVFAGQMAKVEQVYEGYLLVQTDTYENGWVSKEDAVTIW